MAGAGRVDFQVSDADRDLPFPAGSFDAVLCNDAINHFRDRRRVFQEWGRVLRAGGRCLFTDPVVVTGLVSNAELAARSSIGFFLFSVPGANEALLAGAGFEVEQVVDVTGGVVRTSRKWPEAREKRRGDLVRLESEAKYEAIQRFLESVHVLASEKRLSRLAYVGRRART
jgi:SAM-dependent methyltransferase